MDNSTIVGVGLFASTIFIIMLHGVEWFSIGALARKRTWAALDSRQASGKFALIRGGLGVEATYYFLLLVVFTVYFSGNMILLVLVAALGIVHLAAFWASMGRATQQLTESLTTKRVGSVLIFDIAEIIILVFLALQFYSSPAALH